MSNQEPAFVTQIRELKAEIQRLRDGRNYWVRQAMAFSEHADNMRLALMDQAERVLYEDMKFKARLDAEAKAEGRGDGHSEVSKP
jgi:hypothetical protein